MIVPLDENIVGSRLYIRIHDPKIDLGVSSYIQRNKCWEPFETQIFRKLIQGASFFIDVGSNIGYYSIVASKIISPNSKIIAIEPEKDNFSILEDNIIINKATNIRPINAGCLDNEDGAQVLLSNDNYGDHRIVTKKEKINRDKLIHTITIDQLLTTEDMLPDLIKIDTQGSEVAILKGMQNTLNEKFNDICMLVEFWPHGINEKGDSVEEFINLLSGYEVNLCAIFEEANMLINCSIEDLKRWSSTIMSIKTERYINLLIWGKNRHHVKDIISESTSENVNIEGMQEHMSVLGKNKLNPDLVPIGWSFPEESGVWSDGNYSEIIISDFQINGSQNTLEITFLPFICPGKEQTIKVNVNGELYENYTFCIQKITTLEIKIDQAKHHSSKGNIVVSFEFPHAISPRECGMSEDSRLLGIFLMKFTVV